jgi:hypothetical protein
MKHLSMAIAVMTTISFSNAYGQLGGLLKKAKEKANETVNSNSTGSSTITTQPDACISNVKGRCETIVNIYYKNFKKDPSSLEKEATLWFARNDYESARYYYTGGKEGYQNMGRICEVSGSADPRYIELKAIMKDAEEKLLELEKAKGYEFMHCKDNNIVFKDLKTGKELTPHESNKI